MMNNLDIPDAHKAFQEMEMDLKAVLNKYGYEIREYSPDGFQFVGKEKRFKITLKTVKTKQ